MALSDDEQRILRQIEQELQNDEKFAQAVSPAGLYRHSAKLVRWAIVGLVVAFLLQRGLNIPSPHQGGQVKPRDS